MHLSGILDGLHFGCDLLIDLLYLVADLDHAGIARLEGFKLLLILDLERLTLPAQAFDNAVGQELWQIDITGSLNLFP